MSSKGTRKRKLAALLDTMIKQKFEEGDNNYTTRLSEADDSQYHLPSPNPDPENKLGSDVPSASESETTNRIVNEVGVKGFNLLVQLSAHIPASFQNWRLQCSQHILSIGCRREFEAQKVQQLLADIDSLHEFNKEVFGNPPDSFLWEASHAYGLPMLAFLGPPVINCLSCGSPLKVHNRPTTVVCYTLQGPLPAMKITLRCRTCHINYRYSQYGSKANGYTYYRDYVHPFVEASQVCYIERNCCELWNAARYVVITETRVLFNDIVIIFYCSHHAWVSFEGAAEIYNELMRMTSNANAKELSRYLDSHPIHVRQTETSLDLLARDMSWYTRACSTAHERH